MCETINPTGFVIEAKELKAWNKAYDKCSTPISWQFQTTDSRIKLKSLYPNIDIHHKERDNRCEQKLANL
jgi:hypothetical protein